MNSDKIDAFLTFLRDIEQEYHMAEADEQEANYETQDILHSLELETHTYQEYAKISKRMAVVRQKRRVAKDTICHAQPILDWAENNRNVVKSLERLLGDVRKAEKRTQNRVYVPKAKNGVD